MKKYASELQLRLYFCFSLCCAVLMLMGVISANAAELNYTETIITGEHKDLVSRYGSSRMAISDHYLVVGDVYDNTAGYNAGALKVYINKEGIWSLLSKVVAPSASSYDYYGFAVAIQGDYLFAVHGDYNSKSLLRTLLIYRLSDTGVNLVSSHTFETSSPHYFAQKIHAYGDRVMVNRYAPDFHDNFMVYRLVNGEWVFEEEIEEPALASSNSRSTAVFVMSMEADGISFVVNELTTSNQSLYFYKKMAINDEGHWVLSDEQLLGFGGVIEFDEDKNLMCITHRQGTETAAKIFTRDEYGVWNQRLDWIKSSLDNEFVGGCALTNQGEVVVHSYLSDGAFKPNFLSRTLNFFGFNSEGVIQPLGSLVNSTEVNGHTYVPLASNGRFVAYAMKNIYVIDTGKPTMLRIEGDGNGSVLLESKGALCNITAKESCFWEVDAGSKQTILFDPDVGYRVSSFSTTLDVNETLYNVDGSVRGFITTASDDATIAVVFEPLLPDLTIKGVVYHYTGDGPHDDINITVEVHNQGDGFSEATELEVYHSYKDKTLRNFFNKKLSHETVVDVPKLSPGESVMLEVAVRSMPLRGTAYLNLHVDIYDLVSEMNESNNQVLKKYNVKYPRWSFSKIEKEKKGYLFQHSRKR